MIETPRFLLRPLTVSDVSERYLSWLSEAATLRFIIASDKKGSLDQVRQYVAKREGRDDVLFLGIFTIAGEHVGNIKYEPIDRKLGGAVMGILVGEVAWRGKGLAGEVIHASANWLNSHHGIHSIALGVDLENFHAISAYEKVGFVKEATPMIPNPKPGTFSMILRI